MDNRSPMVQVRGSIKAYSLPTRSIQLFHFLLFFGEVRVHLVLRPLFGLLYQPQMMMMMMMNMEQLVQYELTRGTEVLGENVPQCYFVHHKSHMA
jgi:hypothetical protein